MFNQKLKNEIAQLKLENDNLKKEIKALKNNRPLEYTIWLNDDTFAVTKGDTAKVWVDPALISIELNGRVVAHFNDFQGFTTEDI